MSYAVDYAAQSLCAVAPRALLARALAWIGHDGDDDGIKLRTACRRLGARVARLFDELWYRLANMGWTKWWMRENLEAWYHVELHEANGKRGALVERDFAWLPGPALLQLRRLVAGECPCAACGLSLADLKKRSAIEAARVKVERCAETSPEEQDWKRAGYPDEHEYVELLLARRSALDRS